MASDTINPALFNVHGQVTLWKIDEKTGLKLPIFTQSNQIQYSWGFVAANCIGLRRQADRPDYTISGMYVEFENQTNPADTVSVSSSFSRDIGIPYYNSLSSSSTRDFLRVPFAIEPSLGLSAGYAANLPPSQQANKLTFFVQTAGTSGAFGKPFSNSHNSKVFAAALVATPVFGDRTKDVVFARTVFDTSNQVTKEASSQIGVTWDIAFT